jgi:hypothetical protein
MQPETFFSFPSKNMNSTRNVSSAGLFFDGTYDQSQQYPYEFIGGSGSQAGTWKVYIMFGYDGDYFPEVNYQGAISLGFTGYAPSASPTRSPTRSPSRSPTAFTVVPTSSPTNSPYGTFISFQTIIEVDGVNCTAFLTDFTAQEISRLATAQSMGVSDPDVTIVNVVCTTPAGSRRRLAASNSYPVITYGVKTNIDSLGLSADAAYNKLISNLNTSITTGAFTTTILNLAFDLGNTVMSTTTGAVLVGSSDFEVVEVTEDKSSGSDGLDGGAIAGIVIGVVAFVAIVGALVYFFVFKGAGPRVFQRSSSASSNPSHLGGVKVTKKGNATLLDDSKEPNPMQEKTKDLEGL